MNAILVAILILLVTLQCVESQKCSTRCRSCFNNIADCSQKSLVNPPKDFPADTRIIIMDRNFLRVFGRRSFQILKSVEVLKASGNRIRVIRTHAFKNLPSVMTIDLTSNKISKIYPRAFEGIKHVKTLTLSNNKLKEISNIFDKMPTLNTLNLAFNVIVRISSSDFINNTQLHYLDLRNNKITHIDPEAFETLVKLRYLFLNNNPLVELPDMQFGSMVLQLVDFSNCKLTAVPKTFPPAVRDLRLVNNKIQRINNTDFVNITNLKLLALNSNKIRTIGYKAFSHLENLQEIWLRDNKLANIPYGLPDNLRKLYIDSNIIYEIENNLFGNDSKLDYLTVQGNRLTKIDSNAFRGLKFLKYLNLQGNRLKVIKERTFVDLKNLSTLTISSNPIEEIELGAFKNLKNLTFLHMSYITSEKFNLKDNFLTAMPNLQKLDLMNSPKLAQSLMTIIADTFPMKKLKEVVLTYNDLQSLPAELKNVFPEVQAVTVDGNMLVCDKRLLWLNKWMKSSDVKFFSYEPPQCAMPYEVKGQLIKDLPEEQFSKVVEEERPSLDYAAFAAAMKAKDTLKEENWDDSGVEDTEEIIKKKKTITSSSKDKSGKEKNDEPTQISITTEARAMKTSPTSQPSPTTMTTAARTTTVSLTTAPRKGRRPWSIPIRGRRRRLHRRKRPKRHHKNKDGRKGKRRNRSRDGKKRKRRRRNRCSDQDGNGRKMSKRCRKRLRAQKSVVTPILNEP
ncbi:leucine-rich repeat-containing protein 15-like [Gigantopelta aegis]|uniref:leucine-rich repeat-containing protein 15-like n=1 Tax=Gigantopelta aegis TaxID=1735272 RepID=UPI001B88CFA4|nr:leucine-rich repeat-containing protein 15-like [Gigantopelta aegis]